MKRSLDIEIRDSALDPEANERVIQHRLLSTQGKPHYRVFIYLEGPDLPFVNRVEYKLHKSFPRRVRTVRRTLNNRLCKLTIWTWGLFEVQVTVTAKDRSEHRFRHTLTYDRDFDREDVVFEER